MVGRGSAEDEPLVRPFFLTRGRTAGELPLDAVVVTTGRGGSGADGRVGSGAGHGAGHGCLEVEHERILLLCSRPLAVAEVAGHLRLPIGVARVLLDDLRDAGL